MATTKQKAASRRNLVKARAAKRRTPSRMHGSGTGLTSGYRYLPVNVKKRWEGRS